MKILVIDNYDSFTYNLVQLLGRFDQELIVKRNDEITGNEIAELKPDKILISPGPGKPEDSKISLTAIEKFGNKVEKRISKCFNIYRSLTEDVQVGAK